MKRWTPVPPVDNREFWDRIAGTDYGKMMLEDAEEYLATPPVAPPEELYRESFVTRDRAKYEKVYFDLKYQARAIAIGALLDPRPEFIKRFSEILEIFAAMKSWLLPAHDRYPHTAIPMSNVNGLTVTTDLVSIDNASGLSIAIGALETLLDKEAVAKFKKTLARLIIDPLTLIARNRRPYDYWMFLDHNWNAVCYTNTILTFLTADVPEKDRDLVLDFSLEHLKLFLGGFNEDGYCREGPSYFGYGFGHYTYASWALYEASEHKINLFASERVQQIAYFFEKVMLGEHQLPLFCDCNPNIFIRRDMMEIRDYLIGKIPRVDFMPYRVTETGRPQDLTIAQHFMLIGNSSGAGMRPIQLKEFDGFPKTGVFTFRGDDFALCIKGGHNQEYHNHHDVGSYVLVKNDKALLLDPAAPRYNMDSFHSKKSHQNKLRNSYGHAVPVCDGHLQMSGRQSEAIVKEFSANGVTYDMTAPYRNTSLTQLLRKVDFDRPNHQLTITDSAEFSEDSKFAVPLITFGKWEETSPGMLRIYRDGEWEFFCKVDASAEYGISDELIDDDILFPEPVRRILFTFKEKAKSFKISTTFIMENK